MFGDNVANSGIREFMPAAFVLASVRIIFGLIYKTVNSPISNISYLDKKEA